MTTTIEQDCANAPVESFSHKNRIKLKRPFGDYTWLGVLPIEERRKKTPRFSRGGDIDGVPSKRELVCVIDTLYHKLEAAEQDVDTHISEQLDADDRVLVAERDEARAEVARVERNIAHLREEVFRDEEGIEKLEHAVDSRDIEIKQLEVMVAEALAEVADLTGVVAGLVCK